MSTLHITYHVTNWRGIFTPPSSSVCNVASSQNLYTYHRLAPHETPRVGRAFHVYTPMIQRTFILAALLLAVVALASCTKEDPLQETRAPRPSEKAATLQVTMQSDSTASRDVDVKFDIPSDDSPAL